MKKLKIAIIFLVVLSASNIFSLILKHPEKDIGEKRTNIIKAIISQRVNLNNPNLIKIISINNMKNTDMKELIFTIDNNSIKNIIYITNNFKEIIFGSFLNIEKMQNNTLNRYNNINKEALIKQTQYRKVELRLKKQKIKSFISDILNKKYGDLAFRIPGNNKNGEELVLFTDPNCFYCKRYEKNDLPKAIKKSKSIYVVMFPIESLRGHDTSFHRSFWLKSNIISSDSSDEILAKIHLSSNATMDKLKITKNKLYKQFIENTKNMKKTSLINGTPSIFNTLGEIRR
jgi:protein-disulfide isomerase